MNKKDYLNQHGRPRTRREFISRGLMAAGGYAMAPTVLGMLAQSSIARADVAMDPTNAPKFLTFDLSGGAALFGNFLVGGRGGAEDLLPNYDMLGWNPRTAGALDSRFGLPMAGLGVSKMLVGMLAAMSPEAQANFRMGSLLHIGQIDSSDNPLSILSLVDASKLTIGSELSQALGLSRTSSGGRSKPLLDLAKNRAYYVRDLPTLTNAVGLGGSFTGSTEVDRRRLARLLGRLSGSQLRNLLGGNLSRGAYDYLSEAIDNTGQKMISSGGMDPRTVTDFQQIYGINANSAVTASAVLRAALVMNTLKGNTGPSVITIDGCDYHDGSQTSGDNKDQEIGTEIGRAIEAAKRLRVPLMIHVITDGGIYPRAGTRMWQGDSVETCMSVVGYYKPDGVPQYKRAGRVQAGAYNVNQGADRNTLIGSSPAIAANAALANYLNLAGRMDLLNQVYPASLTANALEETIFFA